MRVFYHLSRFIALLTGADAETEKKRADIPCEILSKKQEFTKAELIAHINKKQTAKPKISRSMLMHVPSLKDVKSIIEEFQDGDTIILYDNGLWGIRMGRRGYALVRNGEVIENYLMVMN